MKATDPVERAARIIAGVLSPWWSWGGLTDRSKNDYRRAARVALDDFTGRTPHDGIDEDAA